MNKFLELSYRNHIRNNDSISKRYDTLFDPIRESLERMLSSEVCKDLDETLSDCMAEAMNYAGVVGMELAIGVLNGSMEQVIEN